MVKKNPPNKPGFFSIYIQCMLYFYVTVVLSIFRSVLLRKSYIYLPLKSTKSNKIKNDNSCKVLISCTIYINFISKAQHPNEKL